jgi:hypothetical protein
MSVCRKLDLRIQNDSFRRLFFTASANIKLAGVEISTSLLPMLISWLGEPLGYSELTYWLQWSTTRLVKPVHRVIVVHTCQSNMVAAFFHRLVKKQRNFREDACKDQYVTFDDE